MQGNNITMRQNNAFAMQSGLFLGLWSIAAMACIFYGVRYVLPGNIGQLLALGSPFLATFLTIRFRSVVCAPGQGFSFGTAYLHVLLMGIYAGIWVALFVYIYFAFLDNGQFYLACVDILSRPEMADMVKELEQSDSFQQLQATNDAATIQDMLGAFQSLTPATHAGSIISLTFFTAPVISAIIALVTMRRAHHIH